MKRPYRIEVFWDEDYWAAEFPELPGLAAGHETWEGLLAEIEAVKRAYFESALKHGDPVPEPKAVDQASGKLVLRLPKSLHARAARMADRDEVSLNTFLVAAVAEAVARKAG
jgi:predicted HicB family RNase H-like nuclease